MVVAPEYSRLLLEDGGLRIIEMWLAGLLV
jgi:hypothetical protein